MSITERLFELQDKDYAAFHGSLVPGTDKDRLIGVRMPALRQLAKEIKGTPEAEQFLRDLPHRYYDENALHSIMVSDIKDYDECLKAVEQFLPFIDNWAVCDSLSPKVFRKHRSELLPRIKDWIDSPQVYICRFGMEMLMTHYLDEDFMPDYLELPANVHSNEYYVNMMTAWYFATALAKQWNAAIPYIEQGCLDAWTHNKTIQKARESFRITDEQKEYLKTLKRKQK